MPYLRTLGEIVAPLVGVVAMTQDVSHLAALSHSVGLAAVRANLATSAFKLALHFAPAR